MHFEPLLKLKQRPKSCPQSFNTLSFTQNSWFSQKPGVGDIFDLWCLFTLHCYATVLIPKKICWAASETISFKFCVNDFNFRIINLSIYCFSCYLFLFLFMFREQISMYREQSLSPQSTSLCCCFQLSFPEVTLLSLTYI